jgi:aldose 1-epimerase
MNSIKALITGLAIVVVQSVSAQISVDDFDSIRLYTLKNTEGMTVKITNYGAIVTSISVPDRNGGFADVALGYNRVESYINAVDKPYFGAIVGRYGNRIAKGEFTLDGESYTEESSVSTKWCGLQIPSPETAGQDSSFTT